MHKIELSFFIMPENNKSANSDLHFMLHSFTCGFYKQSKREKRERKCWAKSEKMLSESVIIKCSDINFSFHSSFAKENVEW